MIDRSVKKKVIRDWSEEFTELSVFSQNKLYRKVTPFVIGLELLKVPRSDEYRPIFVCHSLWLSDVKRCLDYPVFLQEIENRKRLQCNIPYAKHSVFFRRR